MSLFLIPTSKPANLKSNLYFTLPFVEQGARGTMPAILQIAKTLKQRILRKCVKTPPFKREQNKNNRGLGAI